MERVFKKIICFYFSAKSTSQTDFLFTSIYFNFFNCQEIMMYETLVILGGKSFKNKEFFHSTQTIADKTGIKRYSVDKILKKFKEYGIIEYQIKGMPNVKYITVLWDNIMELLPEIYQFDEFKKLFSGNTKPLLDYYKLLADTNKEKNINKNTNENIKIEKTPMQQLKSIFLF